MVLKNENRAENATGKQNKLFSKFRLELLFETNIIFKKYI